MILNDKQSLYRELLAHLLLRLRNVPMEHEDVHAIADLLRNIPYYLLNPEPNVNDRHFIDVEMPAFRARMAARPALADEKVERLFGLLEREIDP